MDKKTNCEHEQEHESAVRRAKEEALPSSDLEKICKIFHLLSDEGRLKLVMALMQGEMCVYHLLEVSGGTCSGVSHQLRILRDNGIVKARRLGKNMEYSIADEHIRKIIGMSVEHLVCSD